MCSSKFVCSAILTLLFCFVSILPANAATPNKGDSEIKAKTTVHRGTVVSITDGDTLKVLVNSKTIIIRLEGIDAPERGQPFGNASKEFLRKLTHKRECHVTEKGRDKYQRVLGSVDIAFAGFGYVLGSGL